MITEFQSTLPREERRSDTAFGTGLYNFNPRSHERSDKLFVAVKVWYPIFQSTLPREERLIGDKKVGDSEYFNPRSHERSDHFKWLM